jgi:hypothetical protein
MPVRDSDPDSSSLSLSNPPPPPKFLSVSSHLKEAMDRLQALVAGDFDSLLAFSVSRSDPRFN